MVAVMGPPPRKNIIPGHALSEESFVRLYELFRQRPLLKRDLGVRVDERGYLELARFWIDARGHHEGRQNFGEYGQDHLPVLEQATIEGHAVRATLLAAGVAAFGVAGAQPQYALAAERLWRNMVTRRLYITGGVGAIARDEKFGGDFVLPNDGYLETCAAVACGFLDYNLFLATADAAKVDELERSLYNGALAGVSLKGNTYFYENPLVAGRNRARWSWHACPCCPPMFLKLMGALPGYIYATDADGLYVNLFIGSRTQIGLESETGESGLPHPDDELPVGWRRSVSRRSRTAGNLRRPRPSPSLVSRRRDQRRPLHHAQRRAGRVPHFHQRRARIIADDRPRICGATAPVARGRQGPHSHGDAGAARQGRRPRPGQPRPCCPHAWADRVLPRVP